MIEAVSQKYPNLRRSTTIKVDIPLWTLDNIRDGLEYFRELKGRYPTALEIDIFEYLPSSRQIQRKFGGLQRLRESLGHPDIHLGTGKYRSLISHKIGKRGRNAEIDLEKLLIEKFGEIFVHTEKLFDIDKNRKLRVDFYIYCPEGNFGIDVFTTDNFHNLESNVNAKIGKYINFPNELFLVIAGEEITQQALDLYVSRKTKSMPLLVKLITLATLKEILVTRRSYPDPIALGKGKE